jgi:excisionase family DNA binding protein
MSIIEQASKEMLTAEEAARELGVKESTIRAWLLRRKISWVRLSARCVRIRRAEIDRLIREGTVPAREVRRG